MISFAPTEEQETIRTSMGEFAAQVMRPLARECDESSVIPDRFLQQAWELGVTSIQIPEEHGGFGAPRSPVTNAIVLEELAWGDAALAVAAMTPSLFVCALLDHGTDEQRRAHLPRFCGDRFEIATLAVCEPHPAADPRAPRTRADAREDRFVLCGTKCAVPLGDRAVHFLVIARADDQLAGFLVPREAAGLSISTPEKNLGLRGLTTVRLDLDGVEVAADQRLGGAGGADIGRLLDHARVAQAALLTGLSRAVLDLCIPYAKERVAFDEPIARKQAIAFRFADMHVETECMRWLAWKAASILERGADAARAAELARIQSVDRGMWIADAGLQVLGGHGFIREHPVEMWYRHARTIGVLEGLATV